MVLGFAIICGLITIIAIFSLTLAIQRRESKVGPGLALAIALLLTGLSVWKLPYWSHESTAPTTSHTVKKAKLDSQSGQAFGSSTITTDRRSTEKKIQQQLQSSLKAMGNVSFDHQSKTYVVTVTNADLKKTIAALKQDPSQAKKAKWPQFANGFAKTSASLKKSLGNGYTFKIRVGDQAPVLIFKDGYIIKNSFE
ncbi:hypothetical protein [Levilactobacillus fujinensis]|uniref:DUF308 domain-containing protein n=1 Tax=Levilactobacillus fujinensis TaxID=2486024 RepID=A0ABW1TIK5_9LACO|nr:hypothetical protein [Levilactobacillus fujinensis]